MISVSDLMAKVLLLTCALLLGGGCVDESGSGAQRGNGGGHEVSAAGFEPSEPIPNIHPLLSWANLRLGMSGFELSQVYSAPEGRGDGFTRLLQYYGASINHVINFDRVDDGPRRSLTCAFYRDELFALVDRREGLTAEEAAQWFGECAGKFGEEYTEVVPGAQWSWGEAEGILATFTQDNAGELYMTANLVLEHRPTKRAWHAYNEAWEAARSGGD